MYGNNTYYKNNYKKNNYKNNYYQKQNDSVYIKKTYLILFFISFYLVIKSRKLKNQALLDPLQIGLMMMILTKN